MSKNKNYGDINKNVKEFCGSLEHEMWRLQQVPTGVKIFSNFHFVLTGVVMCFYNLYLFLFAGSICLYFGVICICLFLSLHQSCDKASYRGGASRPAKNMFFITFDLAIHFLKFKSKYKSEFNFPSTKGYK